MSFIVVAVQGEALTWSWTAKIVVVYVWVVGLLLTLIGTAWLAKHVYKGMVLHSDNPNAAFHEALPQFLQPLDSYLDTLFMDARQKQEAAQPLLGDRSRTVSSTAVSS